MHVQYKSPSVPSQAALYCPSVSHERCVMQRPSSVILGMSEHSTGSNGNSVGTFGTPSPGSGSGFGARASTSFVGTDPSGEDALGGVCPASAKLGASDSVELGS